MEDLVGKLFVEANKEYISENVAVPSKKKFFKRMRKYFKKVKK